MVYLILIGIMQYCHGCIKVLHGLKKNLSLCNTFMSVYDLRIGLMEYVLSCPIGIA